jgi:hypothetical protein
VLELPLDALQRWMQAVIVHPGGVDQALRDETAQALLPVERVAEVIRPSRTLSAAERLDIYHGMYPLRMYDALEYDYPGLAHFLGVESFREFVREYVLAYPSRSYTLNRLGDHVPEFLKSARVPKREFCHDLARLELAVTQVFDAPETPALGPERIDAVPAEAWEGARLHTIAAFRLCAFRYPVNDYLQSLRDERHRHPPVRLKNTWVAIYRRDYGVYRLDLSRPAHDLLADLAAGMTLGGAVQAALRRPSRPQVDPNLLFRWFREWVSSGVFRSVELGGAAPEAVPGAARSTRRPE